MAKGGTLANIGQALAGYGSALSGNPLYLQNVLIQRQAQQQEQEREQAARQAQVGNAAALNFLRGSQLEGTPETKAFDVNGRIVGQNRAASPMGADPLRALAMMNNPSSPLQAMAAQRAVSQLFPQQLKGKDRYMEAGGQIFDLATQSVVPGTERVQEQTRGVTIGNRLVDPVTGRVIAQFAPEAKEGWRVISPQRAQALGLSPSGSYQENAQGQIQVITQPKQDRPTQGENTSAYHARRLATGLGSLSEILKKDPSAATTAVPGNNLFSKTMRNEASNRVQAILPEIGDALLTLGTGAAYTQEQFKNQWQANLPALGDSNQVLADKFQRIEALYNQARTNAGPLADQLPDISSIAALYQSKANASPAGNLPITPSQGSWAVRRAGS